MGKPVRPTLEELQSIPAFQRLGEAELKTVSRCLERLTYAQGESVFTTGDPANTKLYLVIEGYVRVVDSEGRNFEAGPGDLLGLSNYLDGLPYHATATALQPSAFLCVAGRELYELENECPVLYRGLNRIIAERIRKPGIGRSGQAGSLVVPGRAAMKSPLATCGPDVSLREAFDIMDSREVGSLVVIDGEERLLGLLTYADLAEAVLVKGASAQDNILKVVRKAPYTVGPDTPLWEVEEIQHNNTLKYVIVTEEGRPVGMISPTDILRAFMAQQETWPATVAKANDLLKLRALKERVSEVAEQARELNRRASAAVRRISDFHRAVQRRCIELTLGELQQAGMGAAPARYALIIMGSVGRNETLLNPDQDNGLIIEDYPQERQETVQAWFGKFTERVNVHLDELGYSLCPGDIMARNPLFHKTLSAWRSQITHITETPTAKAARWANVALDFSLLYGEAELVKDLQQHVREEVRRKPRLLTMMVQDDAQGRPPLGMFNRLITERDEQHKGKIDIKRNGLRILADAARIYSLQAEIGSRNTMDRLTGLVRQGVLGSEYVESVKAAYETLTDMLLDHQLRQVHKGKSLDKLIKLSRRSPMEQETLRMAMRVIKGFQEKLQADFNAVVF